MGSKALVERHHLGGVSAATVRNDMAILEERLIHTPPHTSAGRVPTDAGTSSSTGSSSIKPMSAAEKSAIRTFLSGAVDLDDVVDRTVQLLSA